MKRLIAVLLYVAGLAFAQDSVMSYPPTWKLNPDGSIGPVADRNVAIGTTVLTASPTGGDDTAHIQTALDWSSAGAIVQLAAGNWHTTAPLTLRSGVSLVGNMPQTQGSLLNVSVLTSSGTTATATVTAHGLIVGSGISISGATPTGYNGYYQVATVPDANHITYTLSGSLASPATGTIRMMTGVPADFSIYPAGGTWIDCGGGICLTGSALRGLELGKFGLTNFGSAAVSIGADGVDGISNSWAHDIYMTGSATPNGSEVGWLITNMEHFNTERLMVFHVNTAAHLINQNNFQGFNSVWRSFYGYTYSKTVAAGNSLKHDLWLENKAPAGASATSLSTFSMPDLQLNSYSGDGLNSKILVQGLDNNAPALVILTGLDIEGAAAIGVECQYCQNGVIDFLGVTGPPSMPLTVSLDTNSTFMTLASNHNVATAGGAGTTGCSANHNLFEGHWGTSGLCGTYANDATASFDSNVDSVAASTAVVVGAATAGGGVRIKPGSGTFQPRKGDDSADAPVVGASVKTTAPSTAAINATTDGSTPVFQVDTANRKATTYGPSITNFSDSTPGGGFVVGDSNTQYTCTAAGLCTYTAWRGQHQFTNSRTGEFLWSAAINTNSLAFGNAFASGGWGSGTEGGCVTHADLVIDGSNNKLVSSASYNFVAADVGGWIDVTAGTSWTTGRYQIASVATNKATLATSPGAISLTGGTYLTNWDKVVHVHGTVGATADTFRICALSGSGVIGWQALY